MFLIISEIYLFLYRTHVIVAAFFLHAETPCTLDKNTLLNKIFLFQGNSEQPFIESTIIYGRPIQRITMVII